MNSSGDNPSLAVERVFARIAATRMADLPLNNPALKVEAVSFQPWQGVWVGVLITPWAINLMLLPAEAAAWRELALGVRQTWTFPSGTYEFMGGSDDELGHYQFCSLFSPTFQFAHHDDARAVAAETMVALLAEQAVAPESTAEAVRLNGQSLAAQPLSRRNFLRGGAFGGSR